MKEKIISIKKDASPRERIKARIRAFEIQDSPAFKNFYKKFYKIIDEELE